MSEQEAWQRDCEQAADHHIRTCMEHERRHLASRLADAVGAAERGEHPDPIRAAVTAVVQSAAPYLEQEFFSDTTKAERLAADLQRLDHQLLPSEVCQAMDEAGADLAERVKHIASEHQPEVLRAVQVDDLREAILHSLSHEEQRPAYVPPIVLRLMRLQSCIQGWLDQAPDEHEQLGAVCTELLLLCEHLGIIPSRHQALEVRPDVIRQRATRLLRSKDEEMLRELSALITELRFWSHHDSWDRSEEQAERCPHHDKAERLMVQQLVRLITLLARPDVLQPLQSEQPGGAT